MESEQYEFHVRVFPCDAAVLHIQEWLNHMGKMGWKIAGCWAEFIVLQRRIRNGKYPNLSGD